MKWIITTLMLLIPCIGIAGSVSLEWDANTEADLVGYRVYFSSYSGFYFYGEGSGNLKATVYAPDTSVTVSNLPDHRYYAVVTAYDTENLESGPSNEVTFTIEDDTPVAPSSPEGLFVSGID